MYDLITWLDRDVSAYVPVGATGVIVQFEETTGSYLQYAVRKKGSTDTWMLAQNTATTNQHGFLMTGLDANRVFELYTEATTTKTYLIGYTMAGVTFFTNAKNYSLGSTASWQDLDISGDTAPDTAIGALFTVQTGGNYNFGLRKKGSTDELYNEIKTNKSITALIGVDANQVAQHKIAHTDVDCYLTGYVTSGVVLFTNAVDKSTATTGSYVDVDITGDLQGGDDANGAILQTYTDASRLTAVRKNGASHDYYAEMKTDWLYTAIDTDDIFEQKIQDTSTALYLIGLLTFAAVAAVHRTATHRALHQVFTDGWLDFTADGGEPVLDV